MTSEETPSAHRFSDKSVPIQDKLTVTGRIVITMTPVSTFRHRRLAVIPDADDYIYHAIRSRIQSTLLFQGIYLRNADLVFTILGCPNLTIIWDLEGHLTPLHAAVQLRPPNEQIVTPLINQRQDDIMQRDDEGRVPLHHAIEAAWKTKPPEGEVRSEFANVIRYLMRNMQRTDFDIKDDSGRSPWYLLCDPSNCTCGYPECAASWIRELRDTLEPIRGPALDENSEGPSEPVAPPEDSAQYRACVTTDGTVGEFYHAYDERSRRVQERINLKTPSIYRMMYDPRYGCAKILQFSRRREGSQDFRCRWIHIPANNVRATSRHEPTERLTESRNNG